MQTPPRVGALPSSIVALLLATVPLACGGAKDGESGKEGEAKTPTADAKAEDGAPSDVKAADAKADVDDAKEAADGAAASADGDTAPPPGPGTAASGSPPAATSGADEGGTAAEQPAGEAPAAVDVDALLKEIKSKKTKDARVTAAVAEAEAAGADPVALAKALNSRGEALYEDPERAQAFFELANDKDPKSPSAAFNLAKQAALVGDVDETRKWLTVVHERKGKKLLKRIDFDPMWEIVKDDPEVRALLK